MVEFEWEVDLFQLESYFWEELSIQFDQLTFSRQEHDDSLACFSCFLN